MAETRAAEITRLENEIATAERADVRDAAAIRSLREQLATVRARPMDTPSTRRPAAPDARAPATPEPATPAPAGRKPETKAAAIYRLEGEIAALEATRNPDAGMLQRLNNELNAAKAWRDDGSFIDPNKPHPDKVAHGARLAGEQERHDEEARQAQHHADAIKPR